jgi:hypothetical protein
VANYVTTTLTNPASLLIQKTSPWENGDVESLNGGLHDELLDREFFLSPPESRVILDLSRMD